MQLLETYSHTEVDGVPVVWAPGPAPLAASLVFRVGQADEPFLDGGITHLVEHLVMRAIGRMPIEVNANVGAHLTTFEACGSPPHVNDFLARVCGHLESLDTAALEIERRVLAAEGEAAGPAAEAASVRFGCRGAGLLAYRNLGVTRLDGDAVQRWAARWFTRDNAALALTGPVPDGLRLPLPRGQRAPVVQPGARPLALPGWDEDCGGTAISLPIVNHGGMDLAVGRLLARAAEDVVRHERGLAYDVDVQALAVDPTNTEVAVYADNDPERAPEVVSLLLDVADRLAQDGPSAQELEEDRAQALEALSDPRSLVSAVTAAAQDQLMGLQPVTPAESYRLTSERTASDVREVLRAAAPRTLVLLPDDTALDRPGFRRVSPSTRPVPAGRELRPKAFKGVPRGTRLVYGDAGVALRLPDGDLVAHWDDVVGVTVAADGTHVLQTGDGCAVPVVVGDFRGARDVVALVRERLPASLFVDDPDDGPGEQAS